jgi:hypothetical protein
VETAFPEYFSAGQTESFGRFYKYTKNAPKIRTKDTSFCKKNKKQLTETTCAE